MGTGGSGSIKFVGPPITSAGSGYSADITEDWNCADSGTLTCDLTWTENGTGALEIVGNKVETITGNGDPSNAHTTSAMATDDHCAQAVLTLNGSGNTRIYGGLKVRDDGSDTYYRGDIRNDSATANQVRIVEVTAGSEATLVTDTFTQSNGTPYEVRFCANGSALELYVDDVLELSTTDASITGNTLTGIHLRNNTGSAITSADNFEAGTID